MATPEELIAGLSAKVLDMERDLAGLKGGDYASVNLKIEELRDKIEELKGKPASKPASSDAPPLAKDAVAALLDGE